MNEYKTTPACEGEEITRDGRNLGDTAYHAVGWSTTPDAERADLERVDAAKVDLAVQQVLAHEIINPTESADGYAGLIALFPTDPRVEEWRRKTKTPSG